MATIDDLIEALHTELSFDFVRAAGPGGQNVNKVATAAQLRFDVQRSRVLSQEHKAHLIRLGGRRITSGGVLIIEARRYRSQDQNRDDATARFDGLVLRALAPRRRRLATKPTAASREKRLESKKRKAQVKRARQRHSDER